MFYNTPDKHPVVFLKDVRYDEMKALLEFMYRGEVSVDQENLSSLLKVAEGLKIKGLADVSESHSVMAGPRLPLPCPPGPLAALGAPPPPPHLQTFHSQPGLLSPDTGSHKRLHSATSPNFLGPKRKRGRPRRLSGSEAVPLALSMGEQEMEERARSESRASPLPTDISESEQSPIKSLKDGSGALSLSPGDSKVNDFHSEADSNDGRSSGLLMTPRQESSKDSSREPGSSLARDLARELQVDSPTECEKERERPSPKGSGSGQSPNPSAGTRGNLSSQPGTDPESLQDMSVRGLDLLKYAHIASDGSYRCIQCEKVSIMKSFKNKYSFQRHAFLYHEGTNRKVFPCPVCQKEFSRPDKMKQHLKQVHDCIIPKHEAAAAAAQASQPHFLLNPFLSSLDDPAGLDSKLGGLKDSGRDVFKLMSQIASHTANLKSPGGQGAS